jgi:hypothetical protein
MRGRNEVDPGPDRVLPEPAESYHRSWSTSSDPQYSQQYSQKRYSEPRPSDPYPGEPPREHSQSYTAESDHLPPTIEDPQQMAPPPIVVVPHRGRRH